MIKKCSLCKKEINIKPCRDREYNYCSRKCCVTHCYEIGKLNGQEGTKKAHEVLRVKGHYKRDNTYLIKNNPAKKLEAREKISKAKLRDNYMRGRFKGLSHLYVGGKTFYRGHRWNEIKLQTKIRDSFTCVKCKIKEKEHIKKTGQVLQVDHIIPYKVCKESYIENLQTLCCKCHGKKWKIDLQMIKQNYGKK